MSVRYSWLATIGSITSFAVLIAAEFIATQHIPQLGSFPEILVSVAFYTILGMFISAMILFAIEIMYNETKKIG